MRNWSTSEGSGSSTVFSSSSLSGSTKRLGATALGKPSAVNLNSNDYLIIVKGKDLHTIHVQCMCIMYVMLNTVE